MYSDLPPEDRFLPGILSGEDHDVMADERGQHVMVLGLTRDPSPA
jgi:hypothetical protein